MRNTGRLTTGSDHIGYYYQADWKNYKETYISFTWKWEFLYQHIIFTFAALQINRTPSYLHASKMSEFSFQSSDRREARSSERRRLLLPLLLGGLGRFHDLQLQLLYHHLQLLPGLPLLPQFVLELLPVCLSMV